MSVHAFLARSPLEAAKHSGNENELVWELRHIKSRKTRRQTRTHQVLTILKETNSPRVRNAAAIALADMKASIAKNEIIKLLTRNETKNSRGSLLYALEQMKASIPLSVLVEIIISDGSEAREEALRFLNKKSKFETSEVHRAKQKLKQSLASASSNKKQAEAIVAAIELLGGKHLK